jgi:hypothetical protein
VIPTGTGVVGLVVTTDDALSTFACTHGDALFMGGRFVQLATTVRAISKSVDLVRSMVTDSFNFLGYQGDSTKIISFARPKYPLDSSNPVVILVN